MLLINVSDVASVREKQSVVLSGARARACVCGVGKIVCVCVCDRRYNDDSSVTHGCSWQLHLPGLEV